MRQLRLASGLVPYLGRPLDTTSAAAAVRARVAQREASFLQLARDAGPPHDALLVAAGWDEPRLRASVAQCGLEATLETLRDEGVVTSLAEVKRGADLRRTGFQAATSGTASATPTRVLYDWAFFTEEAAL